MNSLTLSFGADVEFTEISNVLGTCGRQVDELLGRRVVRTQVISRATQAETMVSRSVKELPVVNALDY